ncbi:hypothetical protein [Neobacillus bataviensis]|uniref:alpha-L-rhamnosidase-related protein n=1 Tax=Neobacillus bataviensis TaxID=220685 RepID=UPI0021BD53A1|nr:hypothetical protein [Neobacillus bataviensis]
MNVLAPVLTKIGQSDLAYTLLLQDQMPSWLYSVKNGATTIWERWNSYSVKDGFGDVSMNPFNHYYTVPLVNGCMMKWLVSPMIRTILVSCTRFFSLPLIMISESLGRKARSIPSMGRLKVSGKLKMVR